MDGKLFKDQLDIYVKYFISIGKVKCLQLDYRDEQPAIQRSVRYLCPTFYKHQKHQMPQIGMQAIQRSVRYLCQIFYKHQKGQMSQVGLQR